MLRKENMVFNNYDVVQNELIKKKILIEKLKNTEFVDKLRKDSKLQDLYDNMHLSIKVTRNQIFY